MEQEGTSSPATASCASSGCGSACASAGCTRRHVIRQVQSRSHRMRVLRDVSAIDETDGDEAQFDDISDLTKFRFVMHGRDPKPVFSFRLPTRYPEKPPVVRWLNVDQCRDAWMTPQHEEMLGASSSTSTNAPRIQLPCVSSAWRSFGSMNPIIHALRTRVMAPMDAPSRCPWRSLACPDVIGSAWNQNQSHASHMEAAVWTWTRSSPVSANCEGCAVLSVAVVVDGFGNFGTPVWEPSESTRGHIALGDDYWSGLGDGEEAEDTHGATFPRYPSPGYDSGTRTQEDTPHERIQNDATVAALKAIQESVISVVETDVSSIEMVKNAMQAADEAVLALGSSMLCASVSIVVTQAVLQEHRLQVVVANAGNAKAFLCQTGARKARLLSALHTPMNPDERSRLEAAGVSVVKAAHDLYYVEDMVEVTRVVGGANVVAAVACEPCIRVHDVMDEDTYVVVGTRALWGTITGLEVASITGTHASASHTASELVRMALIRKATQNLAAAVVFLPPFATAVTPQPA